MIPLRLMLAWVGLAGAGFLVWYALVQLSLPGWATVLVGLVALGIGAGLVLLVVRRLFSVGEREFRSK